MKEIDRINQHIDEILELKISGKTYKEIAKLYDSSPSTIGRAVRGSGMRIRTVKTEEDYKTMCLRYENGESIKSISFDYHTSEVTVSNLLKERGVKIRSISEVKQKYTLNECYFDAIDSATKAYLLGWLWSDGHNSINSNAIILTLQEGDRYILDFFNEAIGSNRPIRFVDRSKDTDYNRQNQYRLTIVNKHMSQTLLSYGMNHDKGLTAEFPPVVPNEFKIDFIRGYFEGDGYVSKNPKDCRMNFTGTCSLCESIQEFLYSQFNVNSYLVIPHNKIQKPTRTLYIAGRKQCRIVLDAMYENTDFYLKRKFDIYKSIYAV